MLPATCVVVPTYWTRRGGESRPGDAIYDHPTPIDGLSTLPALLESLGELRNPEFYLLVLVAVTGEDVSEAAEARVRALLAEHPQIVSLVFGPTLLDRLHGRLAASIAVGAGRYLQLRGYPCIRNLQLAVPHALHSEAIVALDDDEIVVDAAFLSKATEPLGARLDGKLVDGLSGHYLQDNGSILLQVDPARAHSANVFDRKAAIMNAGTEMLEKKQGSLVETPFCFGGNMEFTAELVATVGFDPGITRGEDIDYLINARMEGKHFFLRKDLPILHRPPKGGSYKDSSRAKLEQDVVRFLYERAKLQLSQSAPELHPVTAEELSPYPGDFLSEDISNAACEALREAGYEGDPATFVRNVDEQNAMRVENYLDFRRDWPRLQEELRTSAAIRDHLLRRVQGL
jgi:hypothetical protein